MLRAVPPSVLPDISPSRGEINAPQPLNPFQRFKD